MSQLIKLIDKDVPISIKNGVLCIERTLEPKQTQWLDENRAELIKGIVSKINRPVFVYDSYSTGRYGQKKYSGITLRFSNLLTGELGYVNFNACLDRKRTTKYGKKGSALPKGHFTIGAKHSFYKFWLKTGLDIPKRLSSFHDYMGKLKSLLFQFDLVNNEKIDKAHIELLTIEYSDIKKLVVADNIPTTLGQETDNSPTNSSDKVIQLPKINKGFRGNQSTGKEKYELSYKGITDTRDSNSSFNSPIPINEQSNEEWLNDYSQYKP